MSGQFLIQTFSTFVRFTHSHRRWNFIWAISILLITGGCGKEGGSEKTDANSNKNGHSSSGLKSNSTDKPGPFPGSTAPAPSDNNSTKPSDGNSTSSGSTTTQKNTAPDQSLLALAAKVDRDDKGKVVMLDLQQTKVVDRNLLEVPKFPDLIFLYLYDTKISNAAVTHLKKLNNLTLLDLTATAVTEKGISLLRQALPKCNVVY